MSDTHAEETPLLTNQIHTVREGLPVFVRYPSPMTFAVLTVLALGWRLSLGHWTLADGFTMLGVFVYWPFSEWFLHKYLLHLRPRRLFGRLFDPEFSRRHRAHHRQPHKPELIFLPPQVLMVTIPLTVAGFVYLMPRLALAASALLAAFYITLQYEWIHFIVHTRVHPKRAFFQQLFRNHRLHHYRNEHYWYGFTLPLVDTLLGTAPRDSSRVPPSPTCRTLDYD